MDEINLLVVRKYRLPTYTIGKLFINGMYFCDTLEDTVRDVKVQDQTAIPFGEYKVIMSFSGRFNRILPEILDVPNFTAIRIHSGNQSSDTSGCVLVGRNTIKGSLTDSRHYSDVLNEMLKDCQNIRIKIA